MSYDFCPPNLVSFHIWYVVPKRKKQLNECEVRGWVSLEYLQHSPSSHMSPSTHQLASTSLSPNNSVKQQNLVFASSLVNISTRFSSVGIYLSVIFPFLTASQTKWYQISMCLVHAWNLLSFDNAIALWLSQLIVIGLSNPHIFWTNAHRYIASFTVWVCARYSASVLDNVIMYCFLELQVTAPTPMWNEYLEIECLCSCPAQSASQNPSRIMFPHLLKASQRFFMLPRYVIILFTPSHWAGPGFWMNWDRILTMNAASGCKITTGHRRHPIACAYGTSHIWNSCVGVDRLWSFWMWFLGPSVYWLVLHW